MGPKAGRQLRVKKYQAKRRKKRWLAGMMLAVFMAGGGIFLLKKGNVPVFSFEKAAFSLTDEESAPEEMTFSLPGKTWYILELGTFTSEEKARQTAADFQKRGGAGYIFFSQNHYHLAAAAYDTRTKALLVQNNLLSYHGVSTRVMEWKRPHVTFSVSGKSIQVTALCGCLEFLTGLEKEMYTLSLLTDEGREHQKTVFQSLLSQCETGEYYQNQLRRAFQKKEQLPFSPEEMEKFLDEMMKMLRSAAEEKASFTALGSKIKYGQFMVMDFLTALTKEMESQAVTVP